MSLQDFKVSGALRRLATSQPRNRREIREANVLNNLAFASEVSARTRVPKLVKAQVRDWREVMLSDFLATPPALDATPHTVTLTVTTHAAAPAPRTLDALLAVEFGQAVARA